MQNDCAKILSHLSRIQGQIDALKGYVEEERSCEDVAHLLGSITSSFASARSIIIEEMLARTLGDGRLSPDERSHVRAILAMLKK